MHKVLWTSGWDSTFRIIQLVKEGRHVQPYYIIDINRDSTLVEIKRMNEIRELISKKYPKNFEKLKNTIYIDLQQITLDKDKSESYQMLLKKSFMGSQYNWMASLSKDIEGLELCVHIDDKVYHFLNNNIQAVDEESGGGYIVRRDADEHIVNVFGNLKFPILDYSKLDMMDYAKEHDFFEIMERTWFCFTPINNEPCGLCNPCKYSIEEGMSFRFSKKALFRNKYSTFFNQYRRVIAKVERII